VVLQDGDRGKKSKNFRPRNNPLLTTCKALERTQSERSSNGKANAQANFNHPSSNTEVLSNDNTKITPLPPFSGESGPGLSEFLDHYRNNMGAVLISDGLDQKELESVWAELEGAGWKTPSGPITEWKSYSQKKVRALAIEKRSKPGPKGRPMSATEYARFEQEQFETCKKEFGGANELAF
jgi:hypothetical protein